MNFTVKFKRILILGIAVVGVFFLNKTLVSNNTEPRSGFAIQPLSRGFSLAESGINFEPYKNKLKSYPEPESFKKVNYNGQTIELENKCSDLYYTILIYPESIDYREDPASAKFNQAFECPGNKKFSFKVDPNAGLNPGKYYIIIADQGENGQWYNPR